METNKTIYKKHTYCLCRVYVSKMTKRQTDLQNVEEDDTHEGWSMHPEQLENG